MKKTYKIKENEEGAARVANMTLAEAYGTLAVISDDDFLFMTLLRAAARRGFEEGDYALFDHMAFSLAEMAVLNPGAWDRFRHVMDDVLQIRDDAIDRLLHPEDGKKEDGHGGGH